MLGIVTDRGVIFTTFLDVSLVQFGCEVRIVWLRRSFTFEFGNMRIDAWLY